MKVTDLSFELLPELSPGLFESYAVMEDRKRMIHLLVMNASYGMLESGLSWYEEVPVQPEHIGFVSNPHVYFSVMVSQVPTNTMMSDIMTKPPQGKMYVEFTCSIMGTTLVAEIVLPAHSSRDSSKQSRRSVLAGDPNMGQQ